ncbi:MAG: TonB family protein [Gemmatimonadetes bacterium]|nr:TonB family protein [Gemmatimonadota bacterium]
MMILSFIVRVAVVSMVVGGGALAIDRACAEMGKPRRWTWLGAMLASVLIPLVAPVAQRLGLQPVLLPSGTAALLPVSGWLQAHVVVQSPRLLSLTAVVFTSLWVAASLILAGTLAWAHRTALRDASSTVERVDGILVQVTDNVGPAVVGLATPRIVLPRWAFDAPSDERALMLQHEVEHVRAGDAWMLALSAALLVLVPWNIVLWAQQRRLRRAVESDCDARVLARGNDVRRYGLMLLHMTAQGRGLHLAAPCLVGTRRQLEQRIREMTAPAPARRVRRLLPLAATGALLLTSAWSVAVTDLTRSETGGRITGVAFLERMSDGTATARQRGAAGWSPVETITAAPGSAPNEARHRASFVVIDGVPSTYAALLHHGTRRVAAMTIMLPPESVRLYGPRAAHGALIATTR